MELRIVEERLPSAEEWGRVWEECDYATYYHSREWAEVWQKYTQGKLRPEAKLITFSDGKSALLTFSSQQVLKGLVKQYMLSPAGTFGGWLSASELLESHASILHGYIAANYKNLTWRLNPYNSFEHNLNTKNIKSDETHVLDLKCGFETIYKGWTKGHASAARKARKAGVEIREAITLQDWKDYYEIYEGSLKRWGDSVSSRYDWMLFRNMYDLSSSNIKLWLAIYDDQVVAGALCLYAKKHVGYWHGAASAEYFKMRPVNLLMYEIIKNSSEHGYRWFDFNPSGAHEGVRSFKRSFGAKELVCPVIQVHSFGFKVISRVASIISKVKKA
ncbi:MAG: GNAT family N-acetyltransferase [Gammaproteobacteria bacterium]|nr:GNAT family N-acetyltransferase [Gammaproteobacteria bacterium]